MNKCMVAHATQENHDAAREEWFRQRMEKRRLKKRTVVEAPPRGGEIPPEKRAL